MIISGRFLIPRPPRVVQGSIYGLRGDIVAKRVDATVVSRSTYVASNAAMAAASGTHRIVRG